MIRWGAVLAVGLLIGACGGPAPEAGGYVAGDGSIVVLDADQRMAAPDVRGATLDGQDFTLSDHLGQIVVLNVWASWCAPCRAEAPELEDAWQLWQDRETQFVGLNTRDSEVAAQSFVDSMGLTFPSIADPDGRLQLLFSDSLPPQAIPSTIVIDRQGRVAARALGRITSSTLTGILEKVDAFE
jgi:peroxiredoxin